MEVTLVMYKADGARRDFPLNKSRVLIGRHNSCELRVPLPSVSRKHCELKVSGGSVKLRDLGSSNGTYLNGSKVKAETPVAPGDRIQVGAVIFTIVIDGVPASLEPTDTLMAAQAQAEQFGGAGPGESPSRKNGKPASPDAKTDVTNKKPPKPDEAKTKPPAPAEPQAASAASDELDALLSEIGDDLLGRSDVELSHDSGADVELLPDDEDDAAPPPKAKAEEPSEVDDMLSGIEDQLTVDDDKRESKVVSEPADDDEAVGELLADDDVIEDLPMLDDSDEIVDTLPELGDSDEIDIPPSKPEPKASQPAEKSKPKKKPKPVDDDDPISALEAMADGADDSDIDLSWLDDELN